MKIKPLVIANNFHPFYPMLKEKKILVLDHASYKSFFAKEKNYSQIEFLFDFTILDHEEKKEHLRFLTKTFQGKIFSDFGTINGPLLKNAFPQIKGYFSAAFYSPNGTFEGYAQDDHHFQILESFFSFLSLKLERVFEIQIGFTFGRILSVMINESFHALGEFLATEQNLDVATKYGLGLPLGLFEWFKKIGPQPVIFLLKELYKAEGNERYLPAEGLLEAQEKWSSKNV